MSSIPNTFVLDVTFADTGQPVFCSYESDTDSVVVGLSIITTTCPGELVGVFHSDGQGAVEKWIAENPDWYERYKKADK